MSLKDIDISNVEIHYSEIYNVFQGKLTKENRVTIYDKLTDEEFIVDPCDEIISQIILNATEG